jgi:MarR family transcriptional regulator, transcriptional regulator for hemolysin
MLNLTLQERFSKALHTTAQAWKQALDARLRHLGVSQAGWLTIATIAKTQVSLSQSELAQIQSVEGPTMVAMIDRLVKAGLVERRPSAEDRRVNHIALTPAGLDAYAEVRTVAETFRKNMLADIDEDDLRVVINFLEQIQLRIDKSYE